MCLGCGEHFRVVVDGRKCDCIAVVRPNSMIVDSQVRQVYVKCRECGEEGWTTETIKSVIQA